MAPQVSDLSGIPSGSIGSNDLLYLVDIAGGVNTSKKITLGQLGSYIRTNYPSGSGSSSGGLASGDIQSWALATDNNPITEGKLANVRDWALQSNTDPVPKDKLTNVESWALTGGGAIPAGKLTNAPSGGGGGLTETQIKNLFYDWAEDGDTSRIPDTKLPQATTSKLGGIEIANQNEVDALTDLTKAVVPGRIPKATAVNRKTGVIKIATQNEHNALTELDKAVVPGRIPTASGSQKGITLISSTVNASGTDRAITQKGAHDTANDRIETLVKDWARDDSTPIPSGKLSNAPSSSGGGGGVVVENVTVDKTFYLDQKWDDWHGKTVGFRVSNGTDNPKVTIASKRGTAKTGQTVNVISAVYFPGTTAIVFDYTGNRGQRTEITNTKLKEGVSGQRYFDYLAVNSDGHIDIHLAQDRTEDASSTGNANRDLSTAWENGGKIKITLASPHGGSSGVLEINAPNNNAQSSDQTEQYDWTPPESQKQAAIQFFKDQTDASSGSSTATIEFYIPETYVDWTPDAADAGESITFHPFWKYGRISLANIKFARHNSDGVIETIAASQDGENITEGFGEPARLIFANDYYDGSSKTSDVEVSDWHALPIVQDTRLVLDELNKTLVHTPEFEHLEDRVDKALKDEKTSYTIPYYPLFTIPTITASALANNNTKIFFHELETFANSVTVKIAKGSHQLLVEEVFEDHTKTTDLNTIFALQGIPEIAGDIKNEKIAVYVAPTLAADDLTPASAPITMFADARSGRLLSPCPVEISEGVAPDSTRSTGEKVYVENLLYFVYFHKESGSSFDFTEKNVISTTASNSETGTAKSLRIVGDSSDIANARAIVNDHLGVGDDDKAFLIFEDTTGTKRDKHIGTFGVTNLAGASTFNADLSYADITLKHSGSDQTPEVGNLQFFYEEPKPASWAEEGNTQLIPSSKIPAGGSGGSESGAFTIVAEEENFSQAVSGSAWVTLKGSGGITLNADATHLEIEITTPANQTPAAGSTLLYVPPGLSNTVANHHNVIDEDTGLAINVPVNSTKTFRFSRSFFHDVSGSKVAYIILSANGSAGTVYGGDAISLNLYHESDADSASIEPFNLLDTETVVSAQTSVSANLTGATMTNVEFDDFVEFDQIISLTVLLKTTTVSNEQACYRFRVSKDEMDEVGEFTSSDSLASQSAIKGWFRSGWAVSNEQNWVAKPSSVFVKFEYDKSTGLPRVILGYYKSGVYLQGLKICAFGTQCRIDHVSVMRKKG